MPPRRSPRPVLAVGLALATLLGACGTSPDETTTTTSEVAAAAGSGFCLAWGRYQTSISAWLLEPPQTLDDANASAERSRRAAEEARSVAPDDLQEPLDVIVTTLETIDEVVGRAESLEEATAEAGSLFDGSEMTTATTSATDWAALSC